MRRALATVGLLVAVIAAVGYSARPVVSAEGYRFSTEACESLAKIVEQAADARDVGIKIEGYAAFMRRRMERGGNDPVTVRAVLAELVIVYSGAIPAEKLQRDAYTRCMTGPIGGAET